MQKKTNRFGGNYIKGHTIAWRSKYLGKMQKLSAKIQTSSFIDFLDLKLKFIFDIFTIIFYIRHFYLLLSDWSNLSKQSQLNFVKDVITGYINWRQARLSPLTDWKVSVIVQICENIVLLRIYRE